MKHSPPHFFEDMLAMIPSGSFKETDSFDAKHKDICQCWLQGSQMCRQHEDVCPIPEADFAVSGLPCTDMSRAGKHRLREGPTSPVYMVHGKLHCEQKTPLLLLECTPEP